MMDDSVSELSGSLPESPESILESWTILLELPGSVTESPASLPEPLETLSELSSSFPELAESMSDLLDSFPELLELPEKLPQFGWDERRAVTLSLSLIDPGRLSHLARSIAQIQ